MSAYDDLPDMTPGPAPTRRRASAYDDLPDAGTPAPSSSAAAAVVPASAEETPKPGLLTRIKEAIFASAPRPIVPMMPDGVKITEPDVGEFLAENARSAERASRTVRGRITAANEDRRVQMPLVEPDRPSVSAVEGKVVPMVASTLRQRVAEMPGAFADEAARYKVGLDVLTSGGNPEVTKRAAEITKALDQAATERRARTMVFSPSGEVEDSSLVDAARAAPSTLAGVAGGIVGGLPGMAAAVAPAVAPDRYAKTRNLGGSELEAGAATIADVAQEALTEKVGLGLLSRLSKLPAKVALARVQQDPRIVPLVAAELGIQQGGEHASEQASNLVGWLIDKATGDPEATLGQLLEGAKKTAEVTGILSPALGGATLVGAKVRQAVNAARAAALETPEGRAKVAAAELQRAVDQTELVENPAPATEEIQAAPVATGGAPAIAPAAAVGTAAPAAAPTLKTEAEEPQLEMSFGLPKEEEQKALTLTPPVVESPESPVKLATDKKEAAQMRVVAANWARENIVDKLVTNEQTGFQIEIPWRGVKRTISNESYPVDVLTVPAIPQMLESGHLISSEADRKKRPDVKAVHQFVSRVKAGGDVYRVVLTVRELKNKKLFYEHSVIQKETPGAKSETGEGKPSEYVTGLPGADETLLPGDEDGKGPKNLGMPASSTVAPPAGLPPIGQTVAGGGSIPPTAAQAKAAGGKARPDAIRKEFERLFETVISEKHQGHRNLGIYRIKPETIRVRNRNDLRTIAHEIGHHVSNKNKAFRAVMGQHDAELAAMMPAAYKQMVAAGKKMPWKLQVEEGFAEFVADYLGDRAAARRKAPAFYRAFESWLFTNPRYREAIKQVADMIGAHGALAPEHRILAKVGAYTPPLGERLSAVLSKDTWDSFVHGTLDKWHPLKLMVADLAPGLAASKNPYVTARLLAGDAAIIEDWINDFTSPFDYAKRLDVKNYGKPLKAILEPVLGDEQTADKFKAYLIARRAAELKAAGKENLFDAREIADGLALETPQFKQVASEVYAYNDRLVDYAVEGGFLSPETAKAFKQYASYIPFFREPEGEGTRKPGQGSPFKKLRGGTANIRDPIANLIQNTANIVHAVNRNAVLQKSVELAQAVPGGGRWIETVPVPKQALELSTQRIVDELKRQGVQVDTAMAQNLAAMQTFFTPTGKGDDRHRTIVYKVGGELKAAQINDELLWKTLGNLPPLELGLIGKMLAFPAQTLRAGVVLDPTFMARNAIRDTLSATVQSRGKFVPILSTAQGIKMMAQQDDAYKLWRAFGGAFSDQFREPEEAAKAIERMAKRGGFTPGSIVSPMRLLDALKKVGSFSESGSRIGEFASTFKPGSFESALEAAFNAREVSTDFGMRGAHPAVQTWTRVVPFMNPALQGLYKTGRVLSTADGKALATKAAMVGSAMALASMALALSNADDDWYKKLEEWEKATYWHFKLGGEIWRIPKPFEYGAMFASAPEAIALLQQGKEDWRDFKQRMLQVLGQFALRVLPQAATIPLEPWANKSFFTGRKIVPDRQEHLEPGLQSGPGTTKTAQLLGEAANLSPAVIDNVVRNTLGTLGVHVATVSDLALEKLGVMPEGREKTWRSWPVVKAFVHDPDNPNSKQMREFYEDLEDYRRAVATVKELRERRKDERADAYAQDKTAELEMAKRAEKTAKRLAGWRREVARIERSPELSPADKRARINELTTESQAAAESTVAEGRQTRLYSKLREVLNSGAAARSQ